MTESSRVLYQELPKSISNNEPRKYEDLESDLKDFLRENMPASEHKEIDGEFKKTFTLSSKVSKKAKPRSGKRGHYLTALEKKSLGLNKLPKKGLKFKDFRDMNSLWKEYMKELLQTPGVTKDSPVDQSMQMKICRADLHGAFVKVTRSKVDSQVELEGYVVMETRNTLQIVTPDDAVKIIPKKGTSITFVVQKHLVTVSLTNFCMKPSERAVKKWKNKPPYNL